MSIQSRTSTSGVTTYTATVRMPGYGVSSVSETFRTRAEAVTWQGRTKDEIKAGLFVGVANKSVGDVLTYYRDNVLPSRREDHERCLGMVSWWIERLGKINLRVAVSNPAVFDSAFRELEKGVSGSTFNSYLTILTQAFKAAKARRWVPTIPFDGLVARKSTKDNARVRFLDPDELDRLLPACRGQSPFLPYIVCVALGSGGRKGEVSWLRRPDVNIADADPFVSFRGTPSRRKAEREALRDELMPRKRFGRRRQTQVLKDGTSFRKVPLTGLTVVPGAPENIALVALRELFARFPRRTDTDLLFPSPNNPQRPVNFRTAFETAVIKAGIEDFVFHDLRHTFASYKKMSGADEYQLMGLLGHKSTDMVRRYAHIDQTYLREAMGRTRLPAIGI